MSDDVRALTNEIPIYPICYMEELCHMASYKHVFYRSEFCFRQIDDRLFEVASRCFPAGCPAKLYQILGELKTIHYTEQPCVCDLMLYSNDVRYMIHFVAAELGIKLRVKD